MILELETYEVLDDRFYGVRGDAALATHHTGCRWAEGPAYFPAHRTVVWSDIPNDRLLRYDELSGTVTVFRSPAGHPNGNTVDAHGRLVTCEHSNRRVTRTEHDGALTVIADRKRLADLERLVARHAAMAVGLELMRELGLGYRMVYPGTTSAAIWSRGALHDMPAGHVMGVPADLGALAR